MLRYQTNFFFSKHQLKNVISVKNVNNFTNNMNSY